MNSIYTFQSNLFATAIIFGYVLIWIVISEIAARTGRMKKNNSRKLLHIMVGNVVFFLPFFETWLLAVLIPGFFIVGNYLMSPHSPIEKLRMETFEAGHANGTIFYAVSMTILVAFFFNNMSLIFAAFLPLAYGDGFAAVFGERAKSHIFQGVGGQKSLAGTVALFLGSLLSVYLGLMMLGMNAPWLSLVTAILAVVLELISPRGTDNLIIPLGLGLILPFIAPFLL